MLTTEMVWNNLETCHSHGLGYFPLESCYLGCLVRALFSCYFFHVLMHRKKNCRISLKYFRNTISSLLEKFHLNTVVDSYSHFLEPRFHASFITWPCWESGISRVLYRSSNLGTWSMQFWSNFIETVESYSHFCFRTSFLCWRITPCF